MVFELGKVKGAARGPGLMFIVPLIDRVHRVSLRIITMPIQSQGIITKDNVSIDVSAVAYFRVKDPIRSVIAIENVEAAINQIAQTTLRAVVGRHTLDEALSETDTINENIKQILDVQTEEWGIEVTVVELRDIQLPESMQRAMARQAEAEREKRAKIIAAQGEALAAGELAVASDVMMAHPLALQLRNLQTLVEVAVDKNSTVVFPAPLMSTIGELGAFLARESKAAADLPTPPARADSIDQWRAGSVMTTAHEHPSASVLDPERLPADLPTASAPAPLSAHLLDRIDRYWRAANYLSVGQLYLYDNPLLKRPLELSDVKPLVVGHWGTTPGQNFIYVHLNRVITKYGLDMIYVAGPGHGGPALVGNTYLEGSYSEIYPNVSQDELGMKRLFTQFSFPGGISSHVAPTTPGSIHEGGELGYSLSHAFGAAFDNPELIVACVVGDGEAETGPLATAWQSTKFLNPVSDGAVLPILHLNGYKISNPTVLARIERRGARSVHPRVRVDAALRRRR